jgi:hypothetical protein
LVNKTSLGYPAAVVDLLPTMAKHLEIIIPKKVSIKLDGVALN